MRLVPGAPAIGRFALQGFAFVRGVVVADLHDDPAIGDFSAVKLVVILALVAGAGGDLREPAPGEAVVFRDADAVPPLAGPELFARVKQPAVAKLDGTVRTVHDGGNATGPSGAAIRR